MSSTAPIISGFLKSSEIRLPVNQSIKQKGVMINFSILPWWGSIEWLWWRHSTVWQYSSSPLGQWWWCWTQRGHRRSGWIVADILKSLKRLETQHTQAKTPFLGTMLQFLIKKTIWTSTQIFQLNKDVRKKLPIKILWSKVKETSNKC